MSKFLDRLRLLSALTLKLGNPLLQLGIVGLKLGCLVQI